jgi:hypothetical protein
MAMPLKGHRPPVTLYDKNTLAIDSTIIATVNRLCVDATLGGVVPVSQLDDDVIAAGLTSLLVINENYGFDGTNWRRVNSAALGTTAIDERRLGLLGAAFVRGINSGAAAGSQGVAVEARVFAASGDVAKTLYGLMTNSRLSVFDQVTSDWTILYGQAPSAISGVVATSPRAMYTAAINVGIDNTGAAVLRPVEARTGLSFADASYGLMVNARLGTYYIPATSTANLTSTGASSASSNTGETGAGLQTLQARESGFSAARRGKRFVMTGQSPGTLITGGTSFVATAPALMLRINSASYRAIIRSLHLAIGNTPGGPVYVTVALDTSDRYSSGGAAVAPQNMNEESATATGVLAYDNSVAIVASAAGGGTRYIGNTIVPASQGATVDIDLKDGVLMGPTASTLLVYVWAVTTPPQFTYNLEFEDVT